MSRLLSPHFALEDCTFSETAVRAGLDNTPDEAAISGMENLCIRVLEPFRAHFGAVHVNSMFRALLVNRLVGSKDTSQHIATAEHAAADVKVVGQTPLTLCEWMARSGLPFDQVIHEFGAWMHVSWSIHPRGTLLTIDKQGTRPGLLAVRS